MMTNILSIDGGGMKGIVASIVLMKLEKYLKAYSKNENAAISDYFDLVAGTSTGSILTALLLCPDEHGRPKYSAKDALELYITKGKEMFRKKPLYPINTCFGLFGSKYTNKYFKEGLNYYFGDLSISELIRPCLVVTYDMTERRTLFVNSISSRKDPQRDVKVTDVVLASCSAPTYFPPVPVHMPHKRERCLIDGGVAANNPSMSALVEGLKLTEHSTICDTYLMSVGNVTNLTSYTCKSSNNWGIVKFAIPLVDIIMESSEEVVDYQVRKLYESRNMKNHYLRIESVVQESIPKMDDTSNDGIRRLIELGNQLAEREELSIRSFAKTLVVQK